MGDGMKRAALAALMTRGPWRGVAVSYPRSPPGRVGVEWTLTGEEVGRFYHRITAGDLVLATRKADRAKSLLKKAGLIRYDKGVGWVTT